MAEFMLSAFADEIDADFEIQLKSLNTLNIPYIELRGVNGKSFTQLSDSETDMVGEALYKHNIKVWSLGSPIGKAVTNCGSESQLALLARVMDIGEKLGVKRIRVFSFYPEEGDSPETYEIKVFGLMNLLLYEAEKHGFTLCHENEKGIYGCSAAREKKLLDNFDGRLKAVLDNGNFHFCGFSAEGAYALLKDYVEYLHIKDCGNDGVIVPPGYGDAFIRETLREVNADRKGMVVLTMEPHLVNFTGLSALSKTDDIKHRFNFDSPYEAFAYATENVKRMISEL